MWRRTNHLLVSFASCCVIPATSLAVYPKLVAQSAAVGATSSGVIASTEFSQRRFVSGKGGKKPSKEVPNKKDKSDKAEKAKGSGKGADKASVPTSPPASPATTAEKVEKGEALNATVAGTPTTSDTGAATPADAPPVTTTAASADGTPQPLNLEGDLTDEQLRALTPRNIVEILDKFIIGQSDAKRAMAVALRNRWRRAQLQDLDLKADVTPKNILMIGPTGVGKTEIARRMARITDAPFIKVEATKYTEVGFKGKDVESIIEDLYAVAKTRARSRLEKTREAEAEALALEVIFAAFTLAVPQHARMTQAEFTTLLHEGKLDEHHIPVQTTAAPPEQTGLGGRGGRGGGEAAGFPFGGFEIRQRPQKVTLVRPAREALRLAKQEALSKLIDDNHIAALAKRLTEEEGIVFLDEIDKVVADAASQSNDASALGVQQDLLPLIEGSTVTLKDGTQIQTETIFFVCSGAFHVVKPADMIAELQGRLPVRVELKALSEKEFRRILVEPRYSLLKQQVALLGTEGVDLVFAEDGIDAIAAAAAELNRTAQNIGARRLNGILERVLEDVSFDVEKFLVPAAAPVVGESAAAAPPSETPVPAAASATAAPTVGKAVVDKKWVDDCVKPLMKNIDLAKYLL